MEKKKIAKADECQVPAWDELAVDKQKEIEGVLRGIAKCLDARYGPWKLVKPSESVLSEFNRSESDWQAEPMWFLVSGHDKLCAIRVKVVYRLTGFLFVTLRYPPLPTYSGDAEFLKAKQVSPEHRGQGRKMTIDELDRMLTTRFNEPKIGFSPEKIASEIMQKLFPPFMTHYATVCEQIRNFESATRDFRRLALDAGVGRSSVRKEVGVGYKDRPKFHKVYTATKRRNGSINSRVAVEVEGCLGKGKGMNGDPLVDIEFKAEGITKEQAAVVLSALRGVSQRELKKVPEFA